MKTILNVLTVVSLIAMPAIAGAQGNPPNQIPSGGITSVQGIYDKLIVVSNWLFAFLLVFAVIFIIWAAWNYLTAAGDQNKVQKAKDGILYAIIAVAIAVLAKVIINVVANFFGASVTV